MIASLWWFIFQLQLTFNVRLSESLHPFLNYFVRIIISKNYDGIIFQQDCSVQMYSYLGFSGTSMFSSPNIQTTYISTVFKINSVEWIFTTNMLSYLYIPVISIHDGVSSASSQH